MEDKIPQQQSDLDGTVRTLGIDISGSVHRALKIEAAESGMTMREILERAILKYIAESKAAA